MIGSHCGGGGRGSSAASVDKSNVSRSTGKESNTKKRGRKEKFLKARDISHFTAEMKKKINNHEQ